MKFKNKTVVVTGGTKGIGAAIGELYAKEGANVVLTGRESAVLNDMQERAPQNIKYIPLDLEQKNSVEQFLEFLASIECLDVLVNNAGINRIERIENISYENFEAVLNVNLVSPFYICQKAAELMAKQGGKIVNIASIWSNITREGRVSYITSKAGIAGLTRGLATDMAKFNVLVNTVSPGFVMTELTQASLNEQEMKSMRDMIPMQRMAQPSEIANVVAFLTSDENSYITGQNIVVDGGFSNV